MNKSRSGFTIVELLIVVVIIAILAAISVVAYTGVQNRARASAISSDLKAAEKALNAYKIASGASTWWIDTDTTLNGSGSGNPSISSIISANAEFRNFLQTTTTADGLGASGGWFYDNDNDSYNGCSASYGGVNLALTNVTNTALAQAIDNAIDDGNLSCGKVHTADSFLFYSIAKDLNS